MEEGCLLRGIRVIIPERYRADVLNELHVNHPGIVRMKGLARMHVWWPNLDTDIEITVRNCTACQNTQSAPPAATANPWIWPSKPWQRVHIDFCGPFLNEMFLIVVDAHSKWIDVIRMSSTTSEKTINALRCLFSSHGIPTEIVSDNGPQFTSSEFETFLKKNGVKHILSAPYHPSSNGEAERAVRTFKQAMKTVKNESGTLSEKLCRFLLGYRTTPHSTTKRTPAELFVGRRLRTRLDTLKPNINERMQRQRSKTKPCRDIAKGEPVLVRDYRDNNKWKQGVIVHKLGPVTYQVQVGDLVWKRHIDQIREFVPQENKDIPNILENTKSDIDTELIIVPTCNSNRDTENSENNNEYERTKITENKTVENANDTIITRRSERVRKAPERLIENI
ncbi:Uncharacterized protein K02A2.6 [Mytilus coruscus]|uniref:Uncharacterized protein K02A2.6 n=1 Tax=Mytilus coruscus TaxID=42192 RepID=A0A6J8BRL5_MYTCO|nr:Uncharacterized protein K02A2.6 [Mytilus coruscus]